ncbi:hypothetical protein BHU09_06295 [Tannerella sp. oral taxon 808]|nr:hypothetical protein BHU09_06295 [Tannerella sp. oral taxon 808]
MAKWIKRTVKTCLLAPAGAVVAASVLLYVPAVQNVVLKAVLRHVSERVGMEITVGHVRLSYPLDLTLRDVSVRDSVCDTLFNVRGLLVNVRPWPLLRGEVLISQLRLDSAQVHSKRMIEGMQLDGTVGRLATADAELFIKGEELRLDSVLLADANVTLRIDSITPSDTTDTTVNRWRIEAARLDLQRVGFTLQMPKDTLYLTTYLGNATLTGGYADLAAERYGAARLNLLAGYAAYDASDRPRTEGLDPQHIAASNIALLLDSVRYHAGDIRLALRDGSLDERSGLAVATVSAYVHIDSTAVSVSECTLQTARSYIELQAHVPWAALSEQPTADLQAEWAATIDGQDVLTAMGEQSPKLMHACPDTTLFISGLIEGNMNRLRVHDLTGVLPGVFTLEAYGTMEQLMDDRRRSGQVYARLQTESREYLNRWIPKVSGGRFRLPERVRMELEASMKGGEYQGRMTAEESGGRVELTGRYHSLRNEYAVDMRIDSLKPVHFLPKDSLYRLTAVLHAEGRGTDIFSPHTRIALRGSVADVHYGSYRLSGLSLDGSLLNHQAQAVLSSQSPYIKGKVTVEGTVRRDRMAGMMVVDVDTLDLHGLKITSDPLSGSFQLFSEVETDLKRRHRLDLTLGNWAITTEQQTYRPKMLTLHAVSDDDTTRLSFHAGDLGLIATGNADAPTLLQQLGNISDAFRGLMARDSAAHIERLTPLLPTLDLQLEAAQDNPLYNYLQEQNIFFDRLTVHASTSPVDGLQANAQLFSVMKDTMRIDTICLDIRNDSIEGLTYAVDVIKNRFRRQDAFTAGLRGHLLNGVAEVNALYRDSRGETGLQLGVQAEQRGKAYRFHFIPDEPVLAFMPFKLNPENYVEVRSLKSISADLKLTGPENAALWIHSNEDSTELAVEMNQIDLQQLSRFAAIPDMQGRVNVALRYVPSDVSYLIAADANIDNLIFRGQPVGELLLNGVYLPLDNNRHRFDAHFYHNESELAVVSALYRQPRQKQAPGMIDGNMQFDRIPLNELNPFFGGAVDMQGVLRGRLTLESRERGPIWNGFLKLDSTSMYVTAAGTRYRFDDQEVDIKNSKLRLTKYGIYTTGGNPLMISGTVDISKPMKETADLRLLAQNMLLIDAVEAPGAMIYGRLPVDLNLTARGPLRSLKIRGGVHVRRGTNVTYVMPDAASELNNDFSDFVTFTYFSDTVPRRIRDIERQNAARAASIGGMDALLTLRIDPTTRLKIDMGGGERSNRIDLRGGGDLSFHYTSLGDMTMSGRYAISGGQLRYSIPVIPLTDFTIQDGSYVEWQGDLMNPYLNLTALTRQRSTVNLDGRSQMVDFNVGLQVRQQLRNIALKFILEAPKNGTVQTQLAAMGEEERSKQAIGLLVTGVYLAQSGTGNERLDVGTAISSLLQREINNMLGSLSGEVPFSFDVNTYDGTDGKGRRIDYLGRFYMGFLKERFYTTLGMRYSTNDPVTGNRFYLDEASLEYRLDAEGARFVRVYNQTDYENLFEGEIRKTGVSAIFRRKVKRLSDLFDFRKRRNRTVTEEETPLPDTDDADDQQEDGLSEDATDTPNESTKKDEE